MWLFPQPAAEQQHVGESLGTIAIFSEAPFPRTVHADPRKLKPEEGDLP